MKEAFGTTEPDAGAAQSAAADVVSRRARRLRTLSRALLGVSLILLALVFALPWALPDWLEIGWIALAGAATTFALVQVVALVAHVRVAARRQAPPLQRPEAPPPLDFDAPWREEGRA